MSQYGLNRGASAASVAAATATFTTAGNSSAAKASEGTTYVRHKQASVEHIWFGVLGLLFLATAFNASFCAWAAYRRYRSRHAYPRPVHAPPSGRVALRRLPQAVLSGFRIVGFRLRIPLVDLTVLETVLTVLYLGGCLAWSFAPMDGVLPRFNLTPDNWGGNTGKLAAAQLPLAVILALKNNPITWLTGLGHEKLVSVHRIVSRCIFVLTWLHLVGAYHRSPALFLSEGWKVAGLVGAIAQTVTTIFGVKQIRRRYYEIFYSTHVVLILIFLITVHIHCIPVKCDVYVWPVWVIWGFDRLFRAGRYLLFNYLLKPKNPKALVEYIGADGLRVTLKRRVPGGWKAGQHVFLAFPQLGMESHPFTIANVYQKDDDGGEAELMFIVRAMGGQTRTLMDLAAHSGSYELTALFDGPYGHPEDIRPFTTCVFIAGGTGVTYTMSRMHQLIRDIHSSNACAKRIVFIWAVRTEAECDWVSANLAYIVSLAPSSIRLSVQLFVTGRPLGGMDAALPTLKKGYDLEKAITLPARCLSPANHGNDKEGCEENIDETSDTQCSGSSTPTKVGGSEYFGSGASTPTTVVRAGSAIQLSHARIARRSGRPDVRKILEEEVTASEGAIAVDVSGPDGLVDAVRSALCQPFSGPLAALRGTPTVMLSVEQFRM